MKTVDIFTDGACSGNPGPGGWGAVLRYNGHEKELSGGEAETTNNRMELCAVIFALEALREPCEVNLYSDSQYVCNALTQGWAKKWRANGWMRNKKEKALNPDLWERLLNLCEKRNRGKDAADRDQCFHCFTPLLVNRLVLCGTRTCQVSKAPYHVLLLLQVVLFFLLKSY